MSRRYKIKMPKRCCRRRRPILGADVFISVSRFYSDSFLILRQSHNKNKPRWGDHCAADS